MSDTQLERYLQYGTNAERLAFVPNPPAAVQVLYEWYETDTGDTYLYDSTWHLITSAAGVSATGTPAAGNLTKFSAAATITNGDLSGDVTTSGTLVTTLASTAVTPGSYGNGTNVGSFTVDAKGRLTAAANVAITATGAPATAQYVTLATDATLTAERVLTGTSNQIVVTDNGAGSTVVLSTPQSIATSSTPQFARVGFGAAADSSAVAKFSGQYYSPLVADGNSGTTKTLDFDAGNEHYVTLTGNVTFTLSNPKNGGRYVILLNSGAGGFTATWPAAGSAGGVKWPGGTAPTITVTAAKVDLITLIYSSVDDRYYGSFNQNY